MSTYRLRSVNSNGRTGEPRYVRIDPPPSEHPPPPPQSLDGYPDDGSIGDVLDWVGDQPDRAKAAIVAEHGKSRPRTTLLTQLNERTGGRDALE